MKTVELVTYMLNQICEIQKSHKEDQVFYKEELANESWKNSPFIPPEYKKNILMVTSPEVKMEFDVYVLMIKCYEKITGTFPSVNFRLHRNWSTFLERTLDGWDAEELVKKSIVSIIGMGTLSNPKIRLSDVGELKNQVEYIVLCKYLERHISQKDICP